MLNIRSCFFFWERTRSWCIRPSSPFYVCNVFFFICIMMSYVSRHFCNCTGYFSSLAWELALWASIMFYSSFLYSTVEQCQQQVLKLCFLAEWRKAKQNLQVYGIKALAFCFWEIMSLNAISTILRWYDCLSLITLNYRKLKNWGVAKYSIATLSTN